METQEGNRLSEAAPRGLGPAATAVVLTCMAVGATAAETSHGAHEHGVAEVELAVEGSDVVVNFASPMYNLVGFEHAPRDEHDREAFASARALLYEGGNLVLLDADAACTAFEIDVHWDMMASAVEEEHHDDEVDGHDAHDDHADAHDDHADEHEAHHDHADEHDAHDADEADGHDDHDAGEQHADVTVAVRYTCEHANRLNALDITAFESFERLSEVELRAVGPGGAVAESLERGSPQVDLRGLFGR